LGGHSFGNLFLAALSEITGDFAEAVKISSEILVSKGHIYPATMEDVRLIAELDSGENILGETNVGRVGSKIKKLRLEPETCHPLPEVLEAIREADIITIGPGSLFTSLIPPILVQGVAKEIAASSAVKIFICNLMTQPGETEGLSARRHLEIIKDHVPEIDFDHVIVNNHPINKVQAERYESEGAKQIGLADSISPQTIENAEIIYGNLLDSNKKVRHHPDKLARVVMLCALRQFNPVNAKELELVTA
jgi:uncharacterized cofD-like protein